MRFTLAPAAALGVILIAACSDSSGPANSPQFSRQITFPEFEQTLTTAAARVEVELQAPTASDPAVAREVEVQESDDLSDEESVEAPALRFENLENSATACHGTIVLAPAFTIQFDGATTKFEGHHDADLTCAQFVEHVQAALDAGRSPVVEGERAAPATPQAPGDASFAAAELKLEGDDHAQPKVEINVDADNILACTTLTNAPTGCVGVLQVLGLSIALVDGVTELKSEVEHEDMDDEDFEGLVASVTREGTSCTLGSVTLKDGTVVQVVAQTELKSESGDDDHLADLCVVETALAAGTAVEAKGKGLVTSENPRTILAAEVEFEAEDGEMDDEDFRGSVASVTREGTSCTLGSVILKDGTVVQVVAQTELKSESGDDDHIADLCAVETALAAGTAVGAKGKGLVTSQNPRTIAAAEVEFEAEDEHDDSSGHGS